MVGMLFSIPVANMKLAMGHSPSGLVAAAIASTAKKKTSGAKSPSQGFRRMSGKSMRWPDGFIAVDWGTTNRRAYLIDSAGKKTGEFEDGKGVLSVPADGFPAAIAEIRQKLGDKPLLLAGMIGSNRGWKNAPYVPCPAGIDDLVAKLVWAGEREAIVPGVSYIGDGRSDVMRGEEVQLLGALAARLVDPDALVCHPGTHNKWAVLHQAHIQSFRTVMTGELFNLLKEHSILADLLAGKVDDDDAFRRAARDAVFHETLPAGLFSIRASVLLGQMKKEDAASYASGLLIGTDVRIGLTVPTGARVVIMGRPDLARLYSAALNQAERESVELDGEQCFLAGIQEIAKRI
jgi:2-dehydro-3-deoxygalactonokinase